jgi:flagellar operon protein
VADSGAVNSVNIPPVIAPARPRGVPVATPPTGTPQFRDVLRDSAGAAAGAPLKFSAHAMQRLESRNIKLTPNDMVQLNATADKAAAKGAKQSLFLMKDVALVVSIKNRTVITAVDGDSMKDNVFTNIDSAAIIR